MIRSASLLHPTFKVRRHAFGLGILVAFVLVCSGGGVQAQEPVRASLSRALGDTTFEPSNENALFRIGPFQGNLGAGLSLYYTDNASVSNTNTSSRLQLSEDLSLDVRWPLTTHNELDVRFGASLRQNLIGSGGNAVSFALAPDSRISWAVGIGDFRIRLFDSFALIQDPTSDPSVTNVFDLNRFRNDAGFTVDWDLNKVLVTLLVDDTYTTQNARTDNQNNVENLSSLNGDRNTLRASLQAGYRITPTVLVGPTISASETSGSGAVEIDALSPGAFLTAQLSRLTQFELEAGLNFISERIPTTGVVFVNQERAPGTSYYVRGSIRQTVTRYLNAIASISHDLDYSDGLNVTERTLFTVGGTYRVNKRTTLDLNAFYEDGTVLSGFNQGDYSRFGISAGLSYRLGPKLVTLLQYRYTERSSDNNNNQVFLIDNRVLTLPTSSGSYNQNEVTFSVTYEF